MRYTLHDLNSESVPKKYWKGVERATLDVVPLREDMGTHCCSGVWELNGWLYELTYEGLTVIDVRRKKL